ncbi:MAG: sigma-70 family RNA polymerase sigma factor [Actinomycetota bacterium]
MDQEGWSAGDLLRKVRNGEREYWPELVDRFSPMVLAVAARYRLSDADIDDVHQAVWLRLAENMDRIIDPDRLPGWLMTTTKREALRVADGRVNEVIDDDHRDDGKSVEDLVDELAVRELVGLGMAHISERCRALLRLVILEKRSYDEVGSLLAMPIGSIGPTRQRCLASLRQAILRLQPDLR